ncbi:type II toxin-antitoxin system VapC family toxin [Methyloversatilis thermotolerans]|uniref:type II toxin-antitoxin system VapC family toxin n=1 Tax=Methyloversatilis thermotolerans TaxID=1346290 RepID=UPI00036AF1FC|nr:type II toxin-antitoxin system VapC family toxin [Methyloversatilis thermotolerans]
MIVFCDTSALVKLYIEEEGSADLLDAVAGSSVVAVCRVAWAEAMAAFARRARENPADDAIVDEARGRLRTHWPDFAIVEITQTLVELAGDYADTFALRGYDSIQLAAAQTLNLAGVGAVAFACFDSRLNKAARVLGMRSTG